MTTLLRGLLDRAARTMAEVAAERRNEQVRQAGSALYHIATAIFMAWEAQRLAPDYRRLALALLVARHKLLPRDPLNPSAEPASALLAPLSAEAPMSLDEALQLLPR
ncbi:hypothetical protein D9M70_648140 [compost metagenome]